jgi:putative mycofactocin binding protein MftB
VSTNGFDLDAAWQLHPQVSVRPERFGALLYHFGTRRLSFLKSSLLLDVVRRLEAAASARTACVAAGVSPAQLRNFQSALATLVDSHVICSRGDS